MAAISIPPLFPKSPFSQTAGGATIEAKDLCYSVMSNGKMMRIVKNISFKLESGSLCALMGPSGAGKSTILDLLAARKDSGTWSGNVTLDNRDGLVKRESAYVLQDDYHISTLTVEETIMYAAWAKLPEGTSTQERQERVNLLLDMMGLTHIRNSRIGDALSKGISGGQLKRLSIAVEIVNLPRLIFLDEPTSGLDSAIAFEVMTTVRNFVTSERTAITTIHQPSREIFQLFDKLVLVSAGRLIYFGAATDAVVYFTQPELGFKFEGGYKNPAEFVIEISCGQRLADGLRVPRQPEELEVLYKSSRFYRPTTLSNGSNSDSDVSSKEGTKKANRIQDLSEDHTSSWTQTQMLMHRSWVSKMRETSELSAELTRSVLMGVMVGIVFWGKGDVSSPFYTGGRVSSDANAVSALLFTFTLFCMMSNNQAISYFYSRFVLYKSEQASHTYAPLPYWVSQILTSLPAKFVFHFIAVIILYWTVQFNSSADTFFYFLFATFAANVVSFFTALALAASCPNEVTALAIFPAQFLLFALFTGFVVKIDDIPVYWRWATYLVYSRWIYEGLMVNEWEQYDTDDETGWQRFGYGDILSDYGFDNYNKDNSFGIALAFAVVIAGLFYLGLQPAKSKLVKVSDASDVVSVVHSQVRTVSSPLHSAIPVVKRPRPLSQMSQGAGVAPASDLRVNLMDGGGGSHVENVMVVEEPVLEHVPPLGVESFRMSTGAIDLARGCRLVFRDVTYTVTNKHDGKSESTLLKGVTGRAMPGEMVALMGASGAGKSTLLDVLSQRKTTGTIKGEITYNGSTEMKSFAYVMQDNAHMGILTVRESIHYAAELRLSERMSKEAKAKRVQKIIDMLGLDGVANSILGTNDIRGVSGGQLKRVSIGVEIVNLPNLMFLDEPTTGLDSSISLEVMSAVRNLANQNRTVICTIHQPSEETFALFDSLLLLAEGRVIYFGPTMSVVDYFVESPYKFAMRAGANPADFVVAVAGSYLPSHDGRAVNAGELAAYFTASDKVFALGLVINNTPTSSGSGSDSGEHAGASPRSPRTVTSSSSVTEQSDSSETQELARGLKPRTGFANQVKVLVHRRWTAALRQPKTIVGPIVRDFIVGLFYGSVYLQLDQGSDCTDSSCYTDRLSLLYYGIMLMMIGHTDSMASVHTDRLLFYRERGAQAYGTTAYWLSSWVLQIPVMAVNVLAYSLPLYPMAGLRAGASPFGYFFFFMLCANYAGKFSAYAVAAVSENTQVALCYFPALFMFNTFYAGYLVYLPSFPKWQGAWLPYLDFFRFSFQGLVLNEFQNNDDLPESHYYIDQLGFDFISRSGCAAIVLLFVVIFASLFLIALKYVDFEVR